MLNDDWRLQLKGENDEGKNRGISSAAAYCRGRNSLWVPVMDQVDVFTRAGRVINQTNGNQNRQLIVSHRTEKNTLLPFPP
jgi:hypothetical protein